jgi:PAS domain S-box-containing protein
VEHESLGAFADAAVQQTLLGDAAEHADVGILVWNEELRYVAVNQRACALLGVTREELLGRKVGGTLPREQTSESIEHVLRGVPTRGKSKGRDGEELEWLVFQTSAAGLPQFIGLMWPVSAIAP